MKHAKNAIRITAFFALLIILLTTATHTLMLKSHKSKMTRFFEEKQGFDVFFTGQSHMQVGVYPMELWGDYGIASFNLGQSGETIPFTYWILRLAFNYHTPKLVVVETRRMDIERRRLGEYIYPVWDAFPLSLTRLEAALDLEGTVNRFMERLFPLMKYHHRWEMLAKKDFEQEPLLIDNGATHYDGDELAVVEPGEYPVIDENDSLPPTDLALSYLEKTIELCQSKGIEVLLTELPFPASEDEQRYANGVKAIADRYGVEYLNFHHNRSAINLNTDLSDETHVNDSGAIKITAIFGQYIKEHYDIPDRRNDPDYAPWEEQYREYVQYKKDRILEYSDSLVLTLMLLSDRHINTRITIRKDSSRYGKERSMELIRNICASGQSLEKLNEAAESGLPYSAYIDNEKGSAEERTEDVEISEGLASSKYGIELQIYDCISGDEIAHLLF
ncbi:MAG: hypothetical protein Q4G47_01060 [Lachnospiraceae bacterium]|nr:hypothetical protein [Lachnospiraceae bacterium]